MVIKLSNTTKDNYKSIFLHVFKIILALLIFNFISVFVFFNLIYYKVIENNQEGVFYSLYRDIKDLKTIDINSQSFQDLINEVAINNCIMEIYDTNTNTRIYSPYIYEDNVFSITDSRKVFDDSNVLLLMDGKVESYDDKYLYINSLNHQNNQYSMLIRHNDGIFILIQTSNKYIHNGQNVIYKILLLCFAFAALVGLIPAYLMSKNMLSNIQSIKKTAQKIIDKDFSEKCKANQFSEFYELAESINEMSDVIHNQINEIEQKNIMLENDIEERQKQEQFQKDFISNVSHELKTPISIISGYTEGIKLGLVSEKEDIDSYCSVILEECSRMTNIVRQLLDLSAIENISNLNIEHNSISEMLDIIVDKYTVKNSDRSFEKNYKNNLEGYFDYNEIENVLRNYIDNAIKYSDGSIKINAYEDVEDVYIGIWSNGFIEDSEIDKIWNRFYRVDKSHKRNANSTGLGLSIVKAVMNKHNMPFGVLKKNEGIEFFIKIKKNI